MESFFAIVWTMIFFCCAPLLGLYFLLWLVLKLKSLTDHNQDLPTSIERIWYRTILLTPRSIGFTLMAIFSFWLATVSIELSTLSTIGIFFIGILFFLWIYGFGFNIFLFFKARVIGDKLIATKLNYHLLQANDAIRQTLEVGLPKPWGYVIKFRVVVPERLGDDLRVTGLNKSKERGGRDYIELTPQYSKRGEYKLGPVIIEYTDMFGLIKILLVHNEKESLKIVPSLKKISKLNWAVPADKIDDDVIVKKIINSDEMYDVRKYMRGDDIRRIHWKLSAKTAQRSTWGDELMLRKPEVTFVTLGDFVILLDNQVPQTAGVDNFANLEGADDLLDRMIDVAASILDYAARFKTSTKLFYFSGSGKLRRIDPLVNRKEEWLLQLAEIKWVRGRSNSFKFNLQEKELKRSGFYLLTSELSEQRLKTITDSLSAGSSNMVYFPADSYLNPSPKLGGGWKEKLARTVTTKDEYALQVASADNLQKFFMRKKKKISSKAYDTVALKSKAVTAYLQNAYPGSMIIHKNTNYIRILEGLI